MGDMNVKFPKNLDEALQSALNPLKEIGIGANNILNEGAIGVSNIASETKKGLENLGNAPGQLAKNAERNTAGIFSDLGYAINSGDWTSFVNRTLVKVNPVTGPAGLFANPDDVTNLTGVDSAQQKMATKSENQAADLAAQAASAAETNKLNAINTYMNELMSGRKKTPGVSQTLLGQFNPGQTLLTRTR